MNSVKLFEAAVKVVGLLSFGRGVGDLISVASIVLNITTTSVTSNDYYNTLKWGLIYICIGLFLLRATSVVVNFAYPRKESKVEENVSDEKKN